MEIGLLVFYPRLLLGCVFLMSSVTKFVAPARFARDIAAYGVSLRPMAIAISIVLLVGELFAAVSLLSGWSVGTGTLAAATMLAIFMIAIAFARRRGTAPPCGCFGLLYRGSAGRATVFRDAVLLALSLLVFVGRENTVTLWATVSRADEIPYAIASGLAFAAISGSLAVGVISVRQRVDLSRPPGPIPASPQPGH